MLDADGRSATQVKAHFGQSAGNLVEVQSGLKLIFYTMQAEVVHFQGVATLKTA